MFARYINLPKHNSFFLFGARGTGKTTLLKEHYLSDPGTLYIDLLDFETFQDLSLRPPSLKERVNAMLPARVVIDEIQKSPALLDSVHQLIESPNQCQFVMTGSSARKLKRGASNLLAGRAFEYHLFPLLVSELGAEFDLQQALSWGGLPKIFDYDDDRDRKDYLKAYTETYLKQEILEEQIVRKLDPFNRFLPVAAQSSGKFLNFAAISRQVGCSPASIKTYFQILEDTLIGFYLKSYHPSVRKQELQAPKFYLFDTGVKRALARLLDVPVLPQTSYFGELFEHFIIQQIKYSLLYQRRDEELFTYRTQGGLEIDLIVEHPAKPLKLIEIKSTEILTPEHVSNLNSIVGDFVEAEAICLSRDPTTKKIGSVMCYPWKLGISHILDV